MFKPVSSSLQRCARELAAVDDHSIVFPFFAFQRTWGVELIIDVRDADTGATRQRYRVWAKNPATFRLFEGPMTPISYVEEHVVLSGAIEPRAELTFYGHCRSPREVLGALYAGHMGWSDGWLPFGEFFRDDVRLLQLLGGGYGQLAVGPVSFIRALAQTLRPYELRASVLELADARGRIRPAECQKRAISCCGSICSARASWPHR